MLYGRRMVSEGRGVWCPPPPAQGVRPSRRAVSAHPGHEEPGDFQSIAPTLYQLRRYLGTVKGAEDVEVRALSPAILAACSNAVENLPLLKRRNQPPAVTLRNATAER